MRVVRINKSVPMGMCSFSGECCIFGRGKSNGGGLTVDCFFFQLQFVFASYFFFQQRATNPMGRKIKKARTQ